MKKTIEKGKRHKPAEGLAAEYRFDYRKAKPNRFASRAANERLVVELEADVAEVFTTPESVNRVLRALIASMPPTARK